MSSEQKLTSYNYPDSYQQNQAKKFRNRYNNHWKFRLALMRKLTSKFSLPRIGKKDKKDITVGDIGCSIGTFAIEFAKLGYKSYGIDFDSKALKIAEELCEEENVNVKFFYEPFDLITPSITE